MDRKAIELLELPELLGTLRRYLSSPLGEWQLQESENDPLLASRAEAEASLSELGEAIDWLRENEATIGERDSRIFSSSKRPTMADRAARSATTSGPTRRCTSRQTR